jgi:tRNA(fMet)-specific endonuclease VapC
VRKARDPEKLARAYRGLADAIDTFKRLLVLPFTRSAIDRFYDLKKTLPRLGRHDLAIAAIVLECHGTLVTRNWSDFQQIPGLFLEDWSKP